MKLIEERHNKYKEASKQSLTKQLSDKREKYEISHEKYLISRKQEEELREEKIFKKYEGYYFIMKEKKAKEKKKKELANNKLLEKKERLKELDIENEKQRKLIIKKIHKMEKKKLELDKKKDELYQRIKEDMNNHLKEAKDNKNILEKEEDEKREDILDYENYKFNLALEKESTIKTKRANSQYKTLENQKETENRMKEFKKIMNSLQDDSIINKNYKQRRQMYNEKVKKDREEQKREEEKKLEKLGII